MKFFVSFFIFGFLFSVSVQAQPVCPEEFKVVSPLIEQTQEEVDWCTFAASRVVTTHYGLMRSQCELVGDTVNQSCCSPTVCHPNPSKWPHDVFLSSTVNYTYMTYLVTSTPLPFPTIQKEICNNNRPLLAVATSTALYEAGTPNWHAVVVEGYSNISGYEKVRVFDPMEDLVQGPDNDNNNPRFLSYDFFFNSEVTHKQDYINIEPKDNLSPAPPLNLKVN